MTPDSFSFHALSHIKISRIKEEAEREAIPSVSSSTAAFLEMLAVMKRSKNIVEIGCANGYATSHLIRAAIENGGHVTAFEKDAKRYFMAKTNLSEYIENKTLELIEGDALENMHRAGSGTKIDFLFIDAMKRQYKPLLSAFIPLMSKGGVVFSDDIYFQGVLEPQKALARHKSIVAGLREYLVYLKELEAEKKIKNYFYNYEDGMAVSIIL